MGLLRAWRYVSALPLVDVDELVREGVELVLLDRDNTCVPRDAREAPAEVTAWLGRARAAGLAPIFVNLVNISVSSREPRNAPRRSGARSVVALKKLPPFQIRDLMIE